MRTGIAAGALVLAVTISVIAVVMSRNGDEGGVGVQTPIGAGAVGDAMLTAEPSPVITPTISVVDGVTALRQDESLARVLDVVASRDAGAVLAMFVMETHSCSEFRNADPVWCAMNGEVNGRFQAIATEDGGYHWILAEIRALALLEVILKTGEYEPVLATRDNRTPDGPGGVYYIAFVGPEFPASDPRFNYASDTVGNGFGLKIQASAEYPILEFSLLSKGWTPPKWLDRNGDPYHLRLFP
jgi:hypothetical protein